MVAVTVEHEPKVLTDERRRIKATPGIGFYYDEMDAKVKHEVLDALLTRQGYLCAYCMRRIKREDTKRKKGEIAHIEHYLVRHPTNKYLLSLSTHLKNGDLRVASMGIKITAAGTYDSCEESINYNNMLAVCPGGENDKGKPKICDKSRDADVALVINPFDKDSIKKISYTKNGRINSDNEWIERDLNTQLNLNSEAFSLPQNRRAALACLERKLGQFKKKTGAKHVEMRRECARIRKDYELKAQHGKDAPEHLGFLLWGLDRLIKRYS